MMVRHIDKIIGTILVVFTLIAIFIPVHGDDIPSGVVAVFPDSEPTGEEDLGPEQHGSVDHDNSNLTIDFGFYVPTPMPASTSTLDVAPTPTPVSGELDDPSAVTPDDPSVVTLGDPPISEDSLDQVSTGARHFGKRREEVGLRKPCVVIPAEIEDPWFVTDIAMYAASEMYRTGQPFLKWAEENGLAVDQQLFSPTGVREFGAEILEFSLDNINTVMTNSGLGLHWKYAPFIAAGAKAKGVSPESYLEARLQEFARKSNLKTVPRNVFPIFIEYAEGDPRYTKSVNINNWETLLWNDQSFEQSLIPSAYGQTLLRQVLSLKEFLAARHDRNGQPSASGEFLGVDDARGFIGVMTAEAIVNKLWFMATELIHYTETDGGKNIPYFPYQTVVHPGSEEHRINIVDEQSRLFDQLSLLWALSELMQITDPKTPGTYQQVFMQELLAPGVHVDEFDLSLDLQVSELSATSVYALASRLAAIVFNSLLELHYVAEIGTLLDVGVRDCAGEMQEDSEQATPCTPQVSTTYLGLTLTALERYYQVMKSVPGRQEQIGPLIRLVAEFLFNQMYDNDDGGIFDSVSFSLAMTDKDRELKKDDSQKSLDAQMAAMRGLLAAYSVTGDLRYRTRAFEIYRFAEESLWNENLDVYKDQEKRGLYRYTPLDVGTVIGALRELIYQSEDPQQTLEIMKRMKTFVKQITKYAGLQLSEIITSRDQMFLIPVDNMSVIRTALSLDSPFGLAPVLGSEIVLNKDAISALHAKRPTDSCEEARNAFRSTYYYTDIGMYAATELGLRAEGGRQKSRRVEEMGVRRIGTLNCLI